MLWMSRKCTVSAETMRARPIVSTSCTAIGRGSRRAEERRRPYHSRTPSRTGSPSTKCARFAKTVTTGRTSAGNRTFLMRLPPEMSTPAASVSEDCSQVQGRIPQKKNRR